jgi:predicted nucleic acid-binding protein
MGGTRRSLQFVIVLDTSVWIGILLRSDFHHLSSRAWYWQWSAMREPIHLPTTCMTEIAGVLGRSGQSSSAVLRVVDSLDRRPEIQLHSLDHALARFSAEVAAVSRLKGADATFVALAATLGFPLITWDRQQGERGRLFCRTMTPVEAMEMAE